ncbi:hypothetical protein PVK06_010638 [Gossypium arboreum]|uniref:SEC63 domain-containing protein n=1 Tax=Gossypium arboreum TaxID=29729 RepID=A0ABR0Q6P3_GOSAR|nr:hypothetical protein PVK06_010638 [Gossypium arboreum]
MTKPTYTAIVQHAKGGKPATVFVPTRKHVRLTSVDLMSYSKVDNEDDPVFRLRSAEELKPDKIREETLKTTLEHRVGYLDEGLSSLDQDVVLELFEAGWIQEAHSKSKLLHLSDHLSELVENTLNDLEASKCITIEDDMDLSPSLGKIASYIYISYTNIEHFGSSLTSETKMKVLLEILASASEYANLLIRNGEEEVLRRLINHQRFSFENPRCTDPHVKANALLQAHFSRQHVVGNRAKVELLDIAKFCNRFHNIDLLYEVIDSDNVRTGDNVTLQITLDRETQVEPVDAPRYPKAKDEGWWLVIGDTTSNQLVAIKRVSIQRKAKLKLEFAAPVGKYGHHIYNKDNYMLLFTIMIG